MSTEKHAHQNHGTAAAEVVTIRCQSGLSGDMFLTGLALGGLAKVGLEPGSAQGDAWLNERLAQIMPTLAGCASLKPKLVDGIAGWHLDLDLPHAHEHRGLAEISQIISGSAMADQAKAYASACFELLAECEAKAHQKPVAEVHFHEIGALDSILDICGVCSLYVELGAPVLVCSPLPLADGSTRCQHGLLPAPAPAVLNLLQNIPVCPFVGDPLAGELVTPTALALLRALNADFGKWPGMVARSAWLVYGDKVFKNAPNGAIFAFGSSF